MTINREHLAGLELALNEMAEHSPAACALAHYHLRPLIAQAQAAPEAEPVAFMYSDISDTEEYLRLEPFVLIGGDLERHAARAVQGVRSVTPLYAAPQHDAELVELLRDQMTWHEAQDKELSKSGRSDADYHWRRLQHQEQIALIDAKLATLSAKNEWVKP